LGDYISTYLIHLLKDLPGYKAVSLSSLKDYMLRAGYSKRDLQNQNTITELAGHFNSDYTIGGYYSDEGKNLYISFDMNKFEEDSVVSVEKKLLNILLEDTTPATLNTHFDKLLPVIREVVRMELDPAIVILLTDRESLCEIDGEIAGKTPLRLPLVQGRHRIRLLYNKNGTNEAIYDKEVDVAKGNNFTIEKNVFCTLSLDAGEKCSVYIDGEEKGTTPFRENLLTGREYFVRVIYHQEPGKSVTVYEEVIDGDDPIPPLYFHAKDSLSIECNPGFTVSFADEKPIYAPVEKKDLLPGNYRIKVLLQDLKKGSDWIFYDRTHRISSFESVSLDLEDFHFRNNRYLSLIPVAAQFNNREPVKGWIVGSLLASSLSLIGFSVYSMSYNAAMAEEMNDKWIRTGDPKYLDDADGYYSTQYVYENILIGSIAAASLICIYSIIDGLLTNNHMHKLIYND
jgi:hypothetical protein